MGRGVKGMHSSFSVAPQLEYRESVGEASLTRDAAYRWLSTPRGGKCVGIGPRRQKLTYERPTRAMNRYGCTHPLLPRQVATS
jgi:hypothetical protein